MDDIIAKEGLTDTFVYLDNITIAGRSKEDLSINVKKFLDVVARRNLTLNH